jgi:heat shock protein beta
MGKSAENLAQSVFVEKLHARGYEVLLLSEPLDEIFVQNLRHYKYADKNPHGLSIDIHY